MEYQKIIKLLDNTLNQPTEFSTKNLVKINDRAQQIACTVTSMHLTCPRKPLRMHEITCT